MENKKDLCSTCKNFAAFYTKGTKRINKTKYGWCCGNVRIANIHEGCDKFVLKQKRTTNSFFLKKTLNDLLTEISELRKILEAENNETAEK